MKTQFIKNLSGYSGCNLTLFKKDVFYFVRKYSSNPSYNKRLNKQAIKQKEFKNNIFNTPRIIHSGYENNIFYFDMEYIASKPLSEYIAYARTKEIENFINKFFLNILPYPSSNSPDTDLIFKNKICSLKKELHSNEHQIEYAFNILEKFNFSNVPSSYCFGDLTLENILITDDHEIFFIDFLDSFFDSWMIDIAKLLQDIDFHWSYRKDEKDVNRDIRLLMAKEILFEKIKKLPNSEEKFNTIYHLILLNILRIIPYIHDECTKKFIGHTLTRLIKTLT